VVEAKSGRFRVLQQATTRSTSPRFPGETHKEKGPETIRALVNGGAGGIGSDITLLRKVSLRRTPQPSAAPFRTARPAASAGSLFNTSVHQ
jgi:hypothetical protein